MRSPAPLFHHGSSFRVVGLSLLGLIGIGALSGCKPDTGPGSVVVTYTLGNSKTCADVGVSEVRATVFRGSFDEPTVLNTDSIDCEAGEIELDGVEPNTYEVRVVGYNADGVAIFDNLGQAEDDRVVEVFEAAESIFDAEMTARPAELLVRWRLGDGGFDNCVGVGIDRFEIRAFQTGGGSVLLESDLDCELGGDSQGYRLVEDPDRTLNGDLFGEVGIQAVAANGDDVGASIPIVFTPVGPGYAVEVTIECTEDGCVEAQ